MANRQYSEQTRVDAVRRIVDQGHPAAVVARENSVSVSTVQRWVSDSHANPAVRDPALPAVHINRQARINTALRKLREIENELQHLLTES